MPEQTLVLLKLDAIQRGLIGEVISRFEKAGLKITGIKMHLSNEEHAKKHYTEDITKRRGEFVRNKLIRFLTEGPVIAMVLEGINAVEVVRKIVGGTEPRTALPGTIRGDYAHHSYDHADAKEIAIRNLVHASSSKKEAEDEINIWFKKEEIFNYKTVHEVHVF